MIIDFKCSCGAVPHYNYDREIDKYQVICPKCGLESLFFTDSDMAIRDWQIRHKQVMMVRKTKKEID